MANSVSLSSCSVMAASSAKPSAPQLLWASTGLSVALLLCFVAAAWIETRTLDGMNVWIKPAKFAFSFAFLFATLAVVVERMSSAAQSSRWMRVILPTMAIAAWAELLYIGLQAGRGARSHYNYEGALYSIMYSVMGVGAVLLVVGVGIIGWRVAKDAGLRMGPRLRQGVQWGFISSCFLTLLTAGTLSSFRSHFVGTPTLDAAVIPLLGWSMQVGDLRPSHFLALHAMQALPLLGLWLDAKAEQGAGKMRAAVVVYVALTLAVFVQALMGHPLIRA